MYKLLIVEDEKYARQHIEKYVTNNLGEYYSVFAAKNGVEAMEIIEKENIDVVITDIKMPEMSGIELAKFIYENHSHIIVMILSGYEEFEYAKSAIRYNVKEYFVKPFDLIEFKSTLLGTVKKLDKKKNVFSENGALTEERECFFFSLVYGGFGDIEDIREQADALMLDFDFENTPCDVVFVEIGDYNRFINEKWSYTKDSFSVAVSNLLSGFLETDFVYCIHSENGCFEYIVYHTDKKIYSYESIADKMHNILNLPVKIAKKYPTFENLDELLEFGNKKESQFLFSKDDKLKTAIEAAKKYIEENYHKNISREEIAGAVFFSPVYFAKNFKLHTGMNYNDYLIKVRIEKAIELMKQNKYKVYEIAKKVGYENTKYFFRVFKLYTGYTPKDYMIKVLGHDYGIQE